MPHCHTVAKAQGRNLSCIASSLDSHQTLFSFTLFLSAPQYSIPFGGRSESRDSWAMYCIGVDEDVVRGLVWMFRCVYSSSAVFSTFFSVRTDRIEACTRIDPNTFESCNLSRCKLLRNVRLTLKSAEYIAVERWTSCVRYCQEHSFRNVLHCPSDTRWIDCKNVNSRKAIVAEEMQCIDVWSNIDAPVVFHYLMQTNCQPSSESIQSAAKYSKYPHTHSTDLVHTETSSNDGKFPTMFLVWQQKFQSIGKFQEEYAFFSLVHRRLGFVSSMPFFHISILSAFYGQPSTTPYRLEPKRIARVQSLSGPRRQHKQKMKINLLKTSGIWHLTEARYARIRRRTTADPTVEK